jgi:Ca2+-binding RTX toxin-like protein
MNITGTNNSDLLEGTPNGDLIQGLLGNDELTGGLGHDIIIGGPEDPVAGFDDNDRLFGDTKRGEASDDVISGGYGNDFIFGDSFEGDGGGNDTLFGGKGNDSLFGGDGNDFIEGEDGNDLIEGGSGADRMIGGSGNDSYFVDNVFDTVTEDASQGTDDVVSTISYVLGANVENLALAGSAAINGMGNNLNNAIKGNSANNSIAGVGGNDTLNGNDGNDILVGGAGNDILVGGNGNDQFKFGGSSGTVFGSANADTISDFVVGSDKIVLVKGNFPALQSPVGGKLLASEFAVVTNDSQAGSSSAKIVYNSTNGNLFYNSNGATSGFGTGGQFARLSGSPDNLSRANFLIASV